MTPHCPRCSALMRSESDQYGSYLQCMMCGYCNDMATVPAEVRASTVNVPDTDEDGNVIRKRMRGPSRLAFV